MQPLVDARRLEISVQHAGDRRLERLAGHRGDQPAKRTQHRVRLLIDDRADDRFAVWKVLVERTDTNARDFRDARGRQPREAFLLDDAGRGDDDRIDGRARALLVWLFASVK